MSKARNLGDMMLSVGSQNQILMRHPTLDYVKSYCPTASGLRSVNTSAGSNTANDANGKDTGKSFTYYDSFGTPFWSVSFSGYISPGSYYWTWGLWNHTQGHWVPPVFQENEDVINNAWTRTIDGTVYNACVRFKGDVHVYSSQPFQTFDFSNENDGDEIRMRQSASSAAAGSTYSNASQTLYSQRFLVHTGPVSAGHYIEQGIF